MWNWRTSIKATPARNQLPRRTGTASSCGWSSCLPLDRASCSSRDAGSWKAPSHTTHKALLTSIGVPPIMGLTGLLNLLRVGTRLQAARDLGFQEGGAPCPSSRLPTQPTQPLSPPTCLPRAVRAVPPAHEWGPVHALGSPASGQSPAAALPAGSPRRASTDPDDGQPVRRRRGGTS
jgi:hypothetical protein